MTTDEIRSTILSVLADIAPDGDVSGLAPDRDIRDQLDLDSMDVLNVVVGISARVGVDVPETEYDRLRTLDAFVDYVAARAT